jgi:hypothetical protein
MNRELFATSNRNFTDALLAGLSQQHGGRPSLRERIVDCEAGAANYVVHLTVPVEDEPEQDDEPE